MKVNIRRNGRSVDVDGHGEASAVTQGSKVPAPPSHPSILLFAHATASVPRPSGRRHIHIRRRGGRRRRRRWRRRSSRSSRGEGHVVARGLPRGHHHRHPGGLRPPALLPRISRLAARLVGATLSTWYSSMMIASLWEWNGERHTIYRLLAKSIFGHWRYWSITLFQQVASLGNNIAIHIAAGSSLKAVYKHYRSYGSWTLQEFIIFFGVFELLLSQLPDIHSLRWVNALCTISTIGFTGTTIGVTIYSGKRIDRKLIKYSLQGTASSKIFKVFNALGAIAFSFGDAMLPEIQSTVKDPAKKNMYKGVTTAYSMIILTYWQLAFSGYWAFGSGV